jgi:hypothetical protein
MSKAGSGTSSLRKDSNQAGTAHPRFPKSGNIRLHGAIRASRKS